MGTDHDQGGAADDGRSGVAKSEFSSGEGLLLIAGFCVATAAFFALVVIVNNLDTSIGLPALSIVGIVLLLLCLAAIAYVFVRTGLEDRRQALGLPSGSVQAVIALSLVVLFAILSVFVFSSMGKSSLRTITNLTEKERQEQVEKLSTTFAGWEKAGDDTYTIYIRDPNLEARNDVGKQLIVLIGTLMTSAVSFYFGTRATTAGTEITNKVPGGAPEPGSTTKPNDSGGTSGGTVEPRVKKPPG